MNFGVETSELLTNHDHEMPVSAFYLDRFAVSNSQFKAFVDANGYDNSELWPEDIYSQVLQFVDQTGHPGPRFWSNGEPPREMKSHPVVGICWYEANAFAYWAGKRLPTCDEWQRSGTWAGDGLETRYPWGNSFDPKRANLWSSGINQTVPVENHANGSTPNGIFQLTGNVWEWVGTLFETPASDGFQVVMDQPMAEIRGGAFDTYFSSQATCQFRSGQPMLRRGSNLGFRCCVDIETVQNSLDPYAFAEGEDNA